MPSVLPCAENLSQNFSFFPASSFIALTKYSRHPDFKLISIPVFVYGKRLYLKYENINSFQKDREKRGNLDTVSLVTWLKFLYIWNSALVTSKGSEWTDTGLPLRFLMFIVQITQTICVTYSL